MSGRRSTRRARPRAWTGAAAAMLALAAAGCGERIDPTQGMTTGEAIVGLSDAITGLREENAVLQAQLDSLRLVVARQDSVIAILANLAGVALPAR